MSDTATKTDTSTVITIVIPDGSEDTKEATILLRRGDNAKLRKVKFSTLNDLSEAVHALSLEVQEIEFAQPLPKEKKAAKKKDNPVAPVGAPAAKPAAAKPVAADFAFKQQSLF